MMSKTPNFKTANTQQIKPSFLLLGESVVDMISTENAESLENAQTFRRFAGGQVANLAMNLAGLGFHAMLGSCVGDDEDGIFLRDSYHKAGVALDCFQTTKKASTTRATITKTQNTPDFKIERGADQYLKLSKNLISSAEKTSAIHTSAFALSRDPARTTIIALLNQFHENGKIISLDPNYHPEIFPDMEDFLQFLLDLFSIVTILKPSLDDSERIFGAGCTPEEYLDKFLYFGPEVVILTMGRKGSLVGTPLGKTYQILPKQVKVVDTTGAGDAFWSGVLIGFASDYEPAQAASLGQSIAEHKISVFGPLTNFHRLEDYLKISHNTKIL
jgi:fructokinase